MSHPNGEQADPFYPPAATSQPPSSFQESATQFTAAAMNPAPASSVDPATQPVYTSGAATVPPAVPAVVPDAAPAGVPAVVGAADPAVPAAAGYAPGHAPGYVPGYAPGYAAESGTSAFPVTGVPVSGYPMALEPPKKKRTGTIVLTVATIVLGLAAAGFGTMYFLEADARTKADKKVSEQTALLADADKKLKETESKLSTSKEDNAKLTQDLTGARNKTDEVTKARDALAACMQASEAYAASKNNTTAKDLIVKCTEAEKYY